MASADQIKTALLTEHFRYTPLTLLDDIINTVNELVFQAVNAIEESLFNTDVENLGFSRDGAANTVDTTARTEIETGVVQLESLLNATIDKNFDKLEIYTLRNLLTVSNLKEDEGLEKWVMLDHYKDIHPEARSMDTTTPETMKMLQRKVEATEKLQAALKAEAARNEALLSRLRSVTGPRFTDQGMSGSDVTSASATEPQQASFAFLKDTSSSDSKALAQNTRFTLSQLPALKSLLEELRPHVASVPALRPTSDAQNARDAYIESRSRRAMARKGINPDGASSGGAETLGRPIGHDEVMAIEGITGAFGSHGSRRGPDVDRMEE